MRSSGDRATIITHSMSKAPASSGRLYVVATPIGNLADITRRAEEVLASVSLIAAEDTRHSRKLLSHLGISAEMLSLHEHNESQRLETLLDRLRAGEDVALISDAGTPLVSDPGHALVSAAIEAGVAVVPVPGASALLAALSVAGLPADRFQFEGFLPTGRSARRSRLAELAALPHTLVCFESPRRLAGCLADVAKVMGGERRCVVARELTKLHETLLRGSAAELLERVQADDSHALGEAVLLIGATERSASRLELSVAELMSVLSEQLPPGKAAAVAARLTGLPRRELYAGKPAGDKDVE